MKFWGTYSYFVNKNYMLGTRIPSSRKIVQCKTMVLYTGFFPYIRPWSYKRVVLCSEKNGSTPLIFIMRIWFLLCVICSILSCVMYHQRFANEMHDSVWNLYYSRDDCNCIYYGCQSSIGLTSRQFPRLQLGWTADRKSATPGSAPAIRSDWAAAMTS